MNTTIDRVDRVAIWICKLANLVCIIFAVVLCYGSKWDAATYFMVMAVYLHLLLNRLIEETK